MNLQWLGWRFLLLTLSGVFVFLTVMVLPWKDVRWGSMESTPGRVVTVIGEAKSQERSQIATFTASVNVIKDNKDEAIAEVNKKMAAIVEAVKAFGIAEEDIKTQSLSFNQNEESYYEEGRQKSRPGQWRVGNSLEIVLREVDKAGKLSEILSQSGATNLWGPNFSFDETGDVQNKLIDEAMKDARKKAELIAVSAGKKLGSVVSVNDANSSIGGPIFYGKFEGGGGGGAVEPGTGTIYKALTVTFGLVN